MSSIFPGSVTQALGEERTHRLFAATEKLEDLVGQAPSEMTSAVLVPIVGSDRSEVDRRLNALRIASVDDPNDWVYAAGSAGKSAIATNLIGGAAIQNRLVQLSLFDLHSRMLAWYLTALWRADELQKELVDGLATWRVVAAAAMSRSLLEGSLAFVAEADEMAKTWAAMKADGPPKIREARIFSQQLGRLLVQAQYGTRIGERGVRRPQIMKLIERGARIAGLELETLKEQYNWLCDAVHPSFGFQTVYTSQMLRHTSGTQVIVHSGRGLAAVPSHGDTEPTVAIAAVEVGCAALEAITQALPSFLATADDYGLTTGVCFTSRLVYWRRFAKPRRNDPCPCGSARKFKACVHDWGRGGPAGV